MIFSETAVKGDLMKIEPRLSRYRLTKYAERDFDDAVNELTKEIDVGLGTGMASLRQNLSYAIQRVIELRRRGEA